MSRAPPTGALHAGVVARLRVSHSVTYATGTPSISGPGARIPSSCLIGCFCSSSAVSPFGSFFQSHRSKYDGTVTCSTRTTRFLTNDGMYSRHECHARFGFHRGGPGPTADLTHATPPVL